MDVWWNNHSPSKGLESFNWNNHFKGDVSGTWYKLNAFDSACGIEQKFRRGAHCNSQDWIVMRVCLRGRMPWIGKSLYMVPSQSSYYEIVERFFFSWEACWFPPLEPMQRHPRDTPFTISVSLVLLIGIPNKQGPYAQPSAIMFLPRYLKCLCKYILYVLSKYNWFMHYILLHHKMSLFIYRPQLYTVQNLV